jgi:cyanophycinase-like exopeptidase
MDAALLAAPDGKPRQVLVAPFAARPDRERRIAAGNARRWYLGLGADQVDAVFEEADLPRSLAGAGLLVLPGGSPERLLTGLAPHTGLLREALQSGTAISGSSAGAMVLCHRTVIPGRPVRLVPGLGLVPVDLVVPHWSGAPGWLAAIRAVMPPDTVVLGIPERSGALVGPDGRLRAVGAAPFSRLLV